MLASLKGEYEAAFAVLIDGRSDYSSRQFADILLAAGEETEIRASEAERKAKRLCLSTNDVCALLSRSLDDSER